MKSKVAERMLENMPEGIEEKVDRYAEELLSKRKYTTEDMVNFAYWVRDGFPGKRIGIKWNGEFVQFIEGIPVTLSNEQVLKIWEEQK